MIDEEAIQYAGTVSAAGSMNRADACSARRGADRRERHHVSDAEMKSLNITGDALHSEWNYTTKPSAQVLRSSYCSEYPKFC